MKTPAQQAWWIALQRPAPNNGSVHFAVFQANSDRWSTLPWRSRKAPSPPRLLPRLTWWGAPHCSLPDANRTVINDGPIWTAGAALAQTDLLLQQRISH